MSDREWWVRTALMSISLAACIDVMILQDLAKKYDTFQWYFIFCMDELQHFFLAAVFIYYY